MPLKTLSEALYEAVHRSKKPAKQIADEAGISYNYLMRMTMDTSSGVDFNLKHLVPVMKSAGNYEALRVLNQLCGFLPPMRPPRGAKVSAKMEVHEYQKQFNDLVGLLIGYIQEPTAKSLESLEQALLQHMTTTEEMRRRCKNNLINQKEMFHE